MAVAVQLSAPCKLIAGRILATRGSILTRRELWSSLSMFWTDRVSSSGSSDDFAVSLEELVGTRLVELRTKGRLQHFAITHECKAQVCEILGFHSGEEVTWKRVKDLHLIADALQIPADNPSARKSVATADGLRAYRHYPTPSFEITDDIFSAKGCGRISVEGTRISRSSPYSERPHALVAPRKSVGSPRST